MLPMSTQQIASAFDRLRTAIDSLEEDFYRTQLRLAATVLGNSIAAMADDPSPAEVSDAEFAFGDVTSIASEINDADEARLNPAIEEVRQALSALKQTGTLPQEVLGQVGALQEKLRERRIGLERQGFRFEGDEAHIPHHPRELCLPARQLQRALSAAGFTIHALDKLVSSPDEFVYHDVADLIAELEAAVR